MDNPLKYSDFIESDKSITDLIKQLEELKASYAGAIGEVKAKATEVESSIKTVSNATKEGQEQTKKAAQETESLAASNKKLQDALKSATAQVDKLKESQVKLSKEDALILKINESKAGSYEQLSSQYKLNKLRLNAMSDAERLASTEGQQLEHQTKLLQQQMRVLNKGAIDLDKTLLQESHTYAELAARNSHLALEMKKVPLDDTTGKLAKMKKEYLANSDSLKKFDASIGNHQRNVGNYAKGIQEGLTDIATGVAIVQGPLGPIAGRLTAMGSAIGQLTPRLKTATSSLKNFSKALVATGIGLVVFALITLVRAFKSTQAGVDAFNRVMIPLKAVLSVIWGVIQDISIALSKDLKKAFADPGQAIKNFGNLIKEQVINRLKGSIGMMKAVGSMVTRLLKGDFAGMKDAGAEFGEQWLQAATGVEDFADKASGAMDKFRVKVDEGIAKGKQLAAMQEEIEKLQLAQILPLARLRREYEELYSIGQNVNKSDEERLASIEEAVRKKSLLTAEEQKMIDLQIKQLELRQTLNDTSREDLKELEELRAKREDMLAMELRETRRINNVRNSILKKQADDAKRAADKAFRDEQKRVNDEIQRDIENAESLANLRRELAFKALDEEKALRISEIDIMRTTEAEKTRLKMKAEQDRLKAVLALNEAGMSELSMLEIQTIENTIKRITDDIRKVKDDYDLYTLLGLNLDKDKKDAINTSTAFAIDQLGQFLQAQTEATNKAVENAKTQTQATRGRLDAEINAQREGYASNVSLARKEYELAKKTQEQALKQQERAQKAQLAMDAIMQASSLLTASAKIWGQLGFPWAVPALAVMWGSFAASKIAAVRLTKQPVQEYGDGGLEFLSGGSHASGNDIPIGVKGDGTSMRAEGGEAMAIINKKQTQKYRGVLPSIIDSLNKGVFEKRFMQQYDTKGLTVNVKGSTTDMSKLEGLVSEIVGQRSYYVDGEGNTIERYKNLTRKYVN